MTITRRAIWRGVFFLIGFCIETSLGQDPCIEYTRIVVPGARPLNASVSNSASLAECQLSCVNQNNCYGFSWFDSSCYKSLDSLINYSGSDTFVYYSLIRSLSNCNQLQTCSYSWSGTKDKHSFYGVNYNKSNLNDCIKSCQQDSSCLALDWDTVASACYLFTSKADMFNASGIYHFEKNCQTLTTLPTTTTTTSTTTKTTTTTTTTPTVRPGSTTLAATPTISAASATRSGSSASSSSSTSVVTPTKTSSSASSSSTTSTTIPTVSMCNGVKCDQGKSCANVSGNLSCICISFCTENYSPVCGSDSKTYTNDCKLYIASCNANKTITLVRRGTCESGPEDQSGDGGGGEFAHYPAAIKPAYIVLAGLGGGCLLLVLTAIIILCEYPLRGAETYSSSGTLVNGRGGGYASQDIKMDAAGGGDGGEGGDGEGGGEENVEFNPYYNRSELGAPDFTKEENIM